MTKGEIEFAERTALNLFDRWDDVSSYFEKFTRIGNSCNSNVINCFSMWIRRIK